MTMLTNLCNVIAHFGFLDVLLCPAPNGLRYRRLGGRRERQFAGTNLEPRQVLENAQTPTSRVRAVLSGI
jgi:hypothetical protein